ncbi:UNVERIFIED_CONTAM: hypothetical protein Sradi_1231900 [Sesamum radiatum]|uniref:Uncharacterized protein n=1 Tax=Sesamum radiatum TaxID=300843 RepID=A0AAW2UME3_SESRA
MRARTEAEETERKNRKVEALGRRLLEVRAAERAGFWYTANFDGFDALAVCCCCPPPRSITGFPWSWLIGDKVPVRALEFEILPLTRFWSSCR